MNKRFKKEQKVKGFTIVELVIVIAVIAILSAVLIPTFSNVISEAKKAKIISEANSIYKSYLVNEITEDNVQEYLLIEVEENKCIFYVNGEQIQSILTKEEIENRVKEDNNNVIDFETLENYPKIMIIKTEIGDACTLQGCDHKNCVVVVFTIMEKALYYRKENNKTGQTGEWIKVFDLTFSGPY